MCKSIKHQIMAILLVAVILIGLTPITALAAGSISLDKTTYSPGERIRVTATGITQQMIDDDAFVAIYDAGAAHTSWQEWKDLTSVGANIVDLTAPNKNGNYEMRLYSMGGYFSDATMVMKIAFTVGTGSSQPVSGTASISLDKAAYAAGERIRVTAAGITQQMVDDDAFVAIYDAGAAHTSWQEWKDLTSVGANTVDLTAPNKNGNYEMRLYSMGGYFSDATMVMKVSFTVGNATSATPTTPTEPATPATPITPAPITPVTPVTPTAPAGSLTATAVSSGVKLEWPAISGALGYRVYRSTTAGVEGISITDFAITSTSYVDVNVDANTTYYYTLRALLKEANAATGERETLGSPSAQVSVKTGAEILGGNASDMGSATKNVILMKLNDPNMSVNGLTQEIDPGRGTTPQSMNGRTMVPIRAIIETMGGTVDWEDATSKITLSANSHSVSMWLNKKDLVVDDANKTMDVAPVSINSRTMVPVRFAAENVGCVVDWIGSTSEIVIVYYSGGNPATSTGRVAQPDTGTNQFTPDTGSSITTTPPRTKPEPTAPEPAQPEPTAPEQTTPTSPVQSATPQAFQIPTSETESQSIGYAVGGGPAGYQESNGQNSGPTSGPNGPTAPVGENWVTFSTGAQSLAYQYLFKYDGTYKCEIQAPMGATSSSSEEGNYKFEMGKLHLTNIKRTTVSHGSYTQWSVTDVPSQSLSYALGSDGVLRFHDGRAFYWVDKVKGPAKRDDLKINLLGFWVNGDLALGYGFYNDGIFTSMILSSAGVAQQRGTYQFSGDKILFTDVYEITYKPDGTYTANPVANYSYKYTLSNNKLGLELFTGKYTMFTHSK